MHPPQNQYSKKNIWLSGYKSLPFALKDILLYQGIVMTYLRIHTKYHPRETRIPWKHIVCFFFWKWKALQSNPKSQIPIVPNLIFDVTCCMLQICLAGHIQSLKYIILPWCLFFATIFITRVLHFYFNWMKQCDICPSYFSFISEISKTLVSARFPWC